MKHAIHSPDAPLAIGCYSQAIQVGQTVYLSGQIPLDPKTMALVEGGIKPQIKRVFDNLRAVVTAAGRNLDSIVKLTVYLTDITTLPLVNESMETYFKKPYPARTSIEVVALPKDALIEIEAILFIE